MDAWLQRVWYGRSPWAWLLLPLSFLFWIASTLRRLLYRLRVLRSYRVSKPVIIVGNISVGGTGKTPLVIWLANRLGQSGQRVGIITRGYGGRSSVWPQQVEGQSDPSDVGDEAVLLASRTDAIVVAGPDRVADAQRAIELGADIVISDDGLQHYRLARDVEVVVIDGSRQLGNGWLLPAGPLREASSRLKSVDAVVVTQRGNTQLPAEYSGYIVAQSRIDEVVSLVSGEKRSLNVFGDRRVHAIAGIGNPEAFFASLRSAGLNVDGRALPDHAAISSSDLSFADGSPVLMTEKDAVKCRAIADERCWIVPLKVELKGAERLLELIDRAKH